MKLEVKPFRAVTYSSAEWAFFKDKLELYETVPWTIYESTELTILRPKPSLRPGDNIRLDGEPYHVTSVRIVKMLEGPLHSGVINFHFLYKLERGFWKPPEWIQIAEVKVVEQ